MDLMQGLLTRRSVRKFTEEPVAKEDVIDIIKAAQYAPSAHNTQPWSFLVIEDKEALKDFRHLQRSALFAENAPLVILVCGDKNIAFSREKEGWSYLNIDCSAATENLLLAAHAKGLGACWCGATPMTKPMTDIAERFNLPENIVPFAIVVIGHPAETPKQPENRFDETKIHWYKG